MDYKKILNKSFLNDKSLIYKLQNLFILKLVSILIIILSIFSILYSINHYLNIFLQNKSILGLSFILISSGIFIISFRIYYYNQILNHKPEKELFEVLKLLKSGKSINLIDFLSINSFDCIKKSLLNEKQVSAKKLFINLSSIKRISFILNRMGISIKIFQNELNKYYQSSDDKIEVDSVLKDTLESAIAENHNTIETGDIFLILSRSNEFLKKLIFDLDIKSEDLAFIVKWETDIRKFANSQKFDPDNLKLTGGIGRDWASGYTLALSRYAYDLSRSVSAGLPFRYNAHQKEISEIENILSRSTHHNALLIGDPGVGKGTVVSMLTKKINEGKVKNELRNKKVMELNIDFMLAGARTPGEILQRLNAVLQDAVYAGNIIIFIDNIHKLFGGSDQKVGALDASEVLLPFFENPNLYIISTTTNAKYHQVIEAKKSTVEKISLVNINEPNKVQTLQILQEQVPYLEYRHKVLITYKALNAVIELSDQYIYDKAYPEKAIMLLEEASSSAPNNSLLTENNIQKLLTKKTGVPVGDIGSAEKQRLLNLENILHQRVIGQDDAVLEISNAMRRARAGVKSSQKPIGSFLFLGPTGVGKTETAKALAEAYFGSEDKIIRFDMSEFQDLNSLNRFLGAPAGTPNAEAGGEITNAIKDNPFSLILFDEIEKAHPNILNLFLQVLDEGWLTDSLGRKVKFSNAIIIATSNAGAEFIRQTIKEGIDKTKLKNELLEYLQQEKLFRPEFINRFTGVISFKPLSKQEVLKITDLMLKSLQNNILKEKDININIDDEAKAFLAELGFDPVLGARPIKRTIQDKIENLIAKKILNNEISKGSTLNISIHDIKE